MSALVHPNSATSPAVRARLSIDGVPIQEKYLGATVVAGMDSFRAPKAAKVGASSAWALPVGVSEEHNPVGRLLRGQRPAVVVLMFGSNDATARFVPLDELVTAFRSRMNGVIDQLEAAGVIVIMNTVVRHMFDPARPRCDENAGDLSNWRLAVQTSALSAAAGELACERHLPLIDLRHAFDALLNRGIGPDGVHPTAHRQGAGKLDEAGLRCGYNVRNYVTLRMLREVWLAVR
jgi:hypothetical protein